VAWQPERVVVIGRLEGGTYKLIGSGAIVAPHRVLTAAHVVIDGTRKAPKPDLAVRRESTADWIPATVCWRGDGLDAALLEVAPPLVAQAHPLACFDGQRIPNYQPWFARGYPMVGAPEDRSTRLESLTGTTHPYWPTEPHITLNVEAPPANCGGLSGAAVVVGDRIVGVVQLVPRPESWDRKLLQATPVASLLNVPAFLEALGVRAGHDLHQQRVVALRAQIASLLRSDGGICERIGERLGAPQPRDPAAVAEHLVDAVQAKRAANALNQLDEEMEEQGLPKGREIVQRLFWWALRHAVDWSPLQAAHCATFAAPATARSVPVSLELPFLSMTVAELVLAGLDDRPIRFGPGAGPEDPPPGATMLRPSAATIAPLFQRRGQRRVEEVVRHLANEIGELNFRNWTGALSDTDFTALQEHVERRLHVLTHEGRKAARSPRYLVVTEKDLRAQGDASQAWGFLQTSLHAAVPSLRVVLLRTGDFTDAESIAAQVTSMLRQSAP